MAHLTLAPEQDLSGFELLAWLNAHLSDVPPQEGPDRFATPGRLEAGRSLFLTGIAIKQVAANLPEGNALVNASNQALADWEDDFCGTPPRPIPILGLAASLAEFASTLQAGGLQTAIQEEAGRLARKAFVPSQSQTGETVRA